MAFWLACHRWDEMRSRLRELQHCSLLLFTHTARQTCAEEELLDSVYSSLWRRHLSFMPGKGLVSLPFIKVGVEWSGVFLLLLFQSFFLLQHWFQISMNRLIIFESLASL